MAPWPFQPAVLLPLHEPWKGLTTGLVRHCLSERTAGWRGRGEWRIGRL